MQKLDNVVVQPDEVADAMRRGIELIHPFDADESMPYTNYAAPPTGPPHHNKFRRWPEIVLSHNQGYLPSLPCEDPYLLHFDLLLCESST